MIRCTRPDRTWTRSLLHTRHTHYPLHGLLIVPVWNFKRHIWDMLSEYRTRKKWLFSEDHLELHVNEDKFLYCPPNWQVHHAKQKKKIHVISLHHQAHQMNLALVNSLLIFRNFVYSFLYISLESVRLYSKWKHYEPSRVEAKTYGVETLSLRQGWEFGVYFTPTPKSNSCIFIYSDSRLCL